MDFVENFSYFSVWHLGHFMLIPPLRPSGEAYQFRRKKARESLSVIAREAWRSLYV